MFEQLVQFRAPADLSEAIDTAAKRRCQSKSDYVRQSVIDKLRSDKIEIGQPSSPDAGALYDLMNGRRRFALIQDGTIAKMGYYAEKPAEGDWRPVYHEDSEPFDLATKWRLKPIARIEADRVVVTYPVVDKSVEWA